MSTVVTIKDELAFPSEYISFVDLKGRTVTVTIEKIWAEQLQTKGGKANQKLVANLVGKKKKFVINKTNAQRIAECHGTNADLWTGKTIAIKPDKDRFGREMVDCIRVDVAATQKASRAPKTTPPPPAENDFNEQQLADSAFEAEQREPGDDQ